MDIETKIELAQKYNKAYRLGTELVSDVTYDLLLEEIELELSEEDFNLFKQSLMESTGSSKLNYVLGSLEKFKYEEPEKFIKWLKKYNILSLFISLKIDGCSVMASYDEGKFIGCWSKGDSISGTDWSDKGKFIFPQTISYKGKLDIRGELSLIADTYKKLGYKSKRAGTVGIMNTDGVPENIKYIKFYAYEILNRINNKQLEITEQFKMLDELRFQTSVWKILHVTNDICDKLKELYNNFKPLVGYDIDGLVCSPENYIPEIDKFYPEKKIAFKINAEGVEAIVTGIDWEVSKGRLLKPVLLISPIEIDGVTISRCTANNAKWMLERGLDTGSKILIQRSGEIIPKCIEVVSKVDVSLPTVCPNCLSELIWKGVDLQCSNINCSEVKRVEHFIKQIGIENVSEKRLIEFGINTFTDLLNWTPNNNYKSQVDFWNELDKKVFNNHDYIIMRSFSYDGFGSTLFDLLYNHLDKNLELMDLLFNDKSSPFLPTGIGIRTIQKASADWNVNYEICKCIVSDSRYKKPEIQNIKSDIKVGQLTGKNILLTGTFKIPRGQVEKKAEEQGAKIASGVSKSLDILFCAEDQWGTSSKFKKAENLNITILKEGDFWDMIQ